MHRTRQPANPGSCIKKLAHSGTEWFIHQFNTQTHKKKLHALSKVKKNIVGFLLLTHHCRRLNHNFHPMPNSLFSLCVQQSNAWTSFSRHMCATKEVVFVSPLALLRRACETEREKQSRIIYCLSWQRPVAHYQPLRLFGCDSGCYLPPDCKSENVKTPVM